MRIHLRIHLHGFTGNVTEHCAKPLRGKDKQRKDQHADDGQPPFKREHNRQQCDRLDEVGNDIDDGIADGVLRTDHVIVEAGHEFANFGIGKEAQ